MAAPLRWAVWLLWAAAIAGVTVYTTAAIGGPARAPASGGYEALYVALFLPIGALCVLRAVLVRAQRLTWAATGVAVWCWAGGSAYSFWALAYQQTPPYPSLADALWLAYYLISIVALLALMHSGLARMRTNMWADVMVGALALATIGAALLFEPILDSTGGSLSAVATNLAYPLLDVLVVSVLLAAFVINGWRPGRVWLLLGIAWAGQAVIDTLYLLQVAGGTYREGGFLDASWPLLMLLIALAAWQRPASSRTRWVQGGGTLAASIAFAAVGMLVLIYDQLHEVGLVADVLATLTVISGFIRAALTFSDMRALRRGRELLMAHQRILNTAADGILGIDADGTLTFANPAARRMVGYDAGELLGSDLHALLQHTGADGSPNDRARSPVLASLVDGDVHRCDGEVYWCKDGSSFPVGYSSTPLVEAAGTTGAVVVFRDVTARKDVEHAKDQFISIVSHELRTPLTSIRASLGLLASGVLGPLPDDGAAMLGVAVRNSDRLVRLIDDLLDLGRLEGEGPELHVEACDAGDLIRRAAEAVLPAAVAAGVTLELDARPAALTADAGRLVQTLANLISNAVKFSPPGSAVQIVSEPRGDEIRFTVSDHGRGIPSDKLETIFERFVQVDASDSRELGGTGLGLAICRSVVEQHGGRIWARSRPGLGSILAFVVPAVAAADGAIGGYAAAPGTSMTATWTACRQTTEQGHEPEAHPARR